jgi:imidazoleglycerol phosphate synthase cyclase subunit
VIPCLDVRDGRVVKGVKFQNLRVGERAETLAAEYEQQGADELVMLDVSATPGERATCVDTVRRVRESISIPLTVGGGVREADDVARLLDSGADMVAINSAAVANPDLISQLAERFGRQCTVLSLDAARVGENRWEVVTRSGANRTGIDAIDWAKRAESLGAGEILLTSWDRDGTLDGYDVALLRAVRQAVSIPVIASGGASKPADFVAAVRAGANAVLAASIFHDKSYTVGDVKRALADAKVPVRT